MTTDELNVAMGLMLLAGIAVGAVLQLRCVWSELRLSRAKAEHEALSALDDPIV